MNPQIETVRHPEDSPFRESEELESTAELQGELEAAERRIAELEAQLEGQAKARRELVHLVSHELRTPITVISGFTRLIQNEDHGCLNPEQQRFGEEILKACGRLDDFVGDLLGAGPDEDTPFFVVASGGDLHETLVGQLESLSPLLEERELEIEVRLQAEVAGLAFDERRIEQVITNLMTNAIRYGRPAGLIRIESESVFAGDADTLGDRVEISVEDDGPGIPEADRERLFAPYVRGECGRKNSGLGIGLAICRRIIRAHGGQIWVESGKLGGARFVFSLPRARPAGGEGAP